VQWWRDAVFYQVYVPSFTDSDGDGVGDLDGVRSRLGYLELLGVDALWLSPIYPSPMVDHGYDVTDHRGIDPTWGDLDAFDALVADAHAHGIRVTVDLVPNHTSDRHAWFRAALASPPGSPERARYHFRPGRGEDGNRPPNDWLSVFGGPAWTHEPPRDGTDDRDDDREFYLHLFSPAQPDLNWTNLEVWADLDKTLRFWLDRGVDGFRVDAAHGMCKRLDERPDLAASRGRNPVALDDPRFDADDVHDVHRAIRATLDH
jgi:alpha-glucosidase